MRSQEVWATGHISLYSPAYHALQYFRRLGTHQLSAVRSQSHVASGPQLGWRQVSLAQALRVTRQEGVLPHSLDSVRARTLAQAKSREQLPPAAPEKLSSQLEGRSCRWMKSWRRRPRLRASQACSVAAQNLGLRLKLLRTAPRHQAR